VNNSEKTSTYLYLKENEYVMTLPRVVVAGKARNFYPNSLLWLFFTKIKSLKTILSYLIYAIKGWRWIEKTRKLRKRGVLVNAIVIGNGPSQGYLDVNTLTEFKRNGGELICVNFWTENELLNKVGPTYFVLSDPIIFSKNIPGHLREKHEKLLSYMHENSSIVLVCPLTRCNELSKIFGRERIIGFVDHELRLWSDNINPLYPRGYLSMTLYKALALANWFDYRNIYVIGMDNTYPRNIYCDENNKFINHEIHAGDKDYAVDQSAIYNTVGDGIYEIAQIFYDARKFKNSKILNLDRHSLTDAFKKTIDSVSDVLNP
jgi:hypothetical protein